MKKSSIGAFGGVGKMAGKALTGAKPMAKAIGKVSAPKGPAKNSPKPMPPLGSIASALGKIPPRVAPKAGPVSTKKRK